MNEKQYVIILKNDAVGDLTQSLEAINNIIKNNKDQKILIFLSERSKKFSFLINNNNIEFKKLNYDLTIFEKIKLFFFILLNKIDKVYILSPKNFYYLLPIFFFKIKFYGICINNINGYKRPPNFLRKFLYKYVVNDRSAIFKRKSTAKIQDELTFNNSLTNDKKKIFIKIGNQLKKYLPKNYFYFHAKRKILNELGWEIDDLKLMFDELLRFSDNIVLTKDIEIDENTNIFKDNFNSFDFKTLKFIDKSKKVIFFDNIDGEDLYNVILNSKKIVAFHGMMTNIGSINKQQVLDLFHCKIKNWNDYRNCRNSFYEFKPTYAGYDFTIPSNDINKTIRKMRYSLKK